MKKFSFAFVALVAMTGFALGQAKTGSGAGSAAPAKAPAAPAKAGSAAGSAAAASKMEAPKPPAEIAALMKAMGPRGNCTGTGMGGPDMKTEMKFTGTVTHKTDVDGWFIHDSMQLTGTGKPPMKMKMESYMTYDAKMSKWRTVGVMNDGSTSVGTADATAGKWEATSDNYGGMMGNGKFRDHGDMSDPKAGMKMWGEASMDGGKTWTKVYEMTCKK